MNGFDCSDSSEKNPKDNLVYGNDFEGMLEGLEDEDSIEETNCSIRKKRRLSIEQVHALERIFEVDKKLDPERKIKLAQELGLQPRQVAIWFQNRRARWKTKQLERDHRLLKANYEALQLNYSKIKQEKEGLIAQLRGLKEKLGEENDEKIHSVEKASSSLSPQCIFPGTCNDSTEIEPSYMNHEVYTSINLSEMKRMQDFKEGLSDDSDSSGILNEDNYLSAQPVISRFTSSSAFDGILDHSAFSLSTPAYQQQFVRMEEQNSFTADDSCNMFSINQTPFFWYFSEQRN